MKYPELSQAFTGYVSWVGNVSDHDAVIVQILYDLGAVPFVRTNVPQTLMVSITYSGSELWSLLPGSKSVGRNLQQRELCI